jgi:hypothetical protein
MDVSTAVSRGRAPADLGRNLKRVLLKLDTREVPGLQPAHRSTPKSSRTYAEAANLYENSHVQTCMCGMSETDMDHFRTVTVTLLPKPRLLRKTAQSWRTGLTQGHQFHVPMGSVLRKLTGRLPIYPIGHHPVPSCLQFSAVPSGQAPSAGQAAVGGGSMLLSNVSPRCECKQCSFRGIQTQTLFR